MKANLPNKEPGIVDFWNKINLYNNLRTTSKGKEKFILHDGPPYANGNIHMGTALNKILIERIIEIKTISVKDTEDDNKYKRIRRLAEEPLITEDTNP